MQDDETYFKKNYLSKDIWLKKINKYCSVWDLRFVLYVTVKFYFSYCAIATTLSSFYKIFSCCFEIVGVTKARHLLFGYFFFFFYVKFVEMFRF